ncbi:hypothetical protein [Nocardia brasiliensis]|uniref:hypothetical protein n=1 Tax=Nocardia brasiliensis TaxID=37326 RepID=UPI0024539B2A|nr:hypothetical protein [Nocardia brasiliensis]
MTKSVPVQPMASESAETGPESAGADPGASAGNVDGNQAGPGVTGGAAMLSQADVDAAITAAVAAAVAPYADYAEIKQQVAAYAKAEAENLPQLERERQRAEQAEHAAAELRTQNTRHAVAEATSVPAEILAGPVGTDDASLGDYAAKVLAWRDLTRGMRPNPQQGQPSQTQQTQTLSSGRERFESRRKK